MGKAPAFQFYPSDWQNDIKLQVCSMGAQGVLINLMCLMHQSDEYGVLLIFGSIPDHKTVAKLLRIGQKKYAKWLQELVQNGVLSLREDGAVVCKRMVKDEDVRDKRRAAGALGGNPVLVNQQDNQGGKQKPTPSSSSSSSTSVKKKSSTSFVEDATAFRLARYLFNCIRKNKPDFKEPNLHAWARDMDLMLRIDKREQEEMREVIKWCQEDNEPDDRGFCWAHNILSAGKFRKQFDQLAIRMNAKEKEMPF